MRNKCIPVRRSFPHRGVRALLTPRLKELGHQRTPNGSAPPFTGDDGKLVFYMAKQCGVGISVSARVGVFQDD